MEKFAISRDSHWYEAWPDVILTPSGKLVCVFNQCLHHGNRGNTRLMLIESLDRGRTWIGKRSLTEETRGLPYSYNCPRISRLKDGRLAIVVDCMSAEGEKLANEAKVLLCFSDDEGDSWGNFQETPMRGIVPGKLQELKGGRWLLSAHRIKESKGVQYLRYSDDQGATWSEDILVAYDSRYFLCEGSIIELEDHTLVSFLRENSAMGLDCQKVISRDDGQSWSSVIAFPLPGCHRPVAGLLQDGRLMITYRFSQGGKGWLGTWTQNFFGAVTDVESALAEKRNDAWVRIFPIDFDRSANSDLGYSGWVQFPDGEIYVVEYIVDDAVDRGQLRGYSLYPDEILLS